MSESPVLSDRTDLVRAGQTLPAAATPAMPPDAHDELRVALEQLGAGQGLLVRVADLMGGALGRATRFGARSLGVAPHLQSRLRGVAEAALARAYDVAILGLDRAAPRHTALRAPGLPGRASRQPRADGRRMATNGRLGKAAVMMSGAAGGFAGMGGFIPDATFTTLAIMRSIAGIAQEEGEDLSTPEARRACLEVFAFRSTAEEEGDSEIGYLSARLLMQGRPMVMLLSEVSARYGVTLSQKFALQAVPIAGALTGAALNVAFLAHYRDIARAHFTVRRLERSYGQAAVHAAAAAIRSAIGHRLPTT